MELDYVQIGKRIANRRRELGLKQYKVCELVGVNYKYLSNIETGRSAPSLELIMKLCSVLKTTPNYLLLGISSNEFIAYNSVTAEKISSLSDNNQQIILGVIDLLDKYSPT